MKERRQNTYVLEELYESLVLSIQLVFIIKMFTISHDMVYYTCMGKQ